MPRRFRPFRSPWSLLLVVAALVLTMVACNEGSTSEGQSCNYNPSTNSCM